MGSPWIWAIPAFTSLLFKGTAEPTRAKESASAYRRFAVLLAIIHTVGLGLIGFGQLVLRERYWSEPTVYFSQFQALGLMLASILVVLAIGEPLTTFARRTLSGGTAYATLLAVGDREKEAAVPVLKAKSKVVGKQA